MRRVGLNVQLLVINAILLASIVAAFVVILVAIHDLRDAHRVSDDEQQLILAGGLERRVIELQASVRGYAIAGKAEFLAPSASAMRAVPQLERRLLAVEATSGDDGHIVSLRRLFADVRAYRAHAKRVLAVAQENPADARLIIAGGEGSRLMARVRRGLAAYSAGLAREAASARAFARDSANRTIILGVISLLALALANGLVGGLVALGVVRPLRRFARGAQRLSDGDLTVRVQDEGAGEVRVLGHNLNAMAASLEANRNELQARRRQLERVVDDLSSERDRIQRFHDFVARLAESRQLSVLGHRMLKDLCALADADAAALFVIDVRGGTDRLWLAATDGLQREELPALLQPGERLAGKAVAESHVIETSHRAGEVRIAGLAGPLEVRRELFLPIAQGGEILGLVRLLRGEDAAFGDSTIEELEQLMHSAAAALATALALRSAENAAELNRAVLNSLQDAYIATDQRGVIEAWSPQAESLFGYSDEEAIGRPLDTLLLPEGGAEHLHRPARVVAEAREGSHLERFEVWTSTKDGRRLLAEMSTALVGRSPQPLVTYFARDISERRHHEEVRRAEEQVSRALAEADTGEDVIGPILAAIGENLGWAFGAFWVYEERPRQLRCVHVWSRDEAGWENAEDLSIDATFDPDEPSREDAPMRDAWRSGAAKWIEPPPLPAISERRAALLAQGIRAELMLPIRTAEGTLGVIEFGSLSTEPPSSETLESLRSITDLVGQVVERRRALEEAERLKSEFFALVSHELRTPLTSVSGYLDIVYEEDAGPLNDEQRRYLQVIRRNTERLLRLVGDLLFVAQVEAGTLALEFAPVDLAAIVHASVEAARPVAARKDVGLKAEIEPVTIEEGDGDRLGQLVDNLISNALKFTPEGGSVHVGLREIEVDRVLVEVADTGIGISAADQEHLFERFYRAEAVTKRAIPGIGLGLSICQAIAEGHNGLIDVQSEEGHGTTFRVELPIGQASSPQLSPPGRGDPA